MAKKQKEIIDEVKVIDEILEEFVESKRADEVAVADEVLVKIEVEKRIYADDEIVPFYNLKGVLKEMPYERVIRMGYVVAE